MTRILRQPRRYDKLVDNGREWICHPFFEKTLEVVNSSAEEVTPLQEEDATNEGTLENEEIEENEEKEVVVILNIIPLSGEYAISRQVICVDGEWSTEAIDMTPFHKESSFSVTATKVLESGEEGPMAILDIPNNFQCPWGYVPVPAPKDETFESFCVAKYEMKDQSSSSDISPDAFIPRAFKTPYVATKQEAQVSCQELGQELNSEDNFGEYDLIKNDEWQTLARNIELVGDNWGDGSVGSTKGLTRGYSTIEDTGTIEGLEASREDNQSCEGLPIYDETIPGYDFSKSLSGECDSFGYSRRRTHHLSNREVIWDLAGNLCEWVKEELGNNHKASITENIYISQVMNGGDADAYPLVTFDYDSGVADAVGGPFDETRKVLKDLFGPSRDYTDLNSHPENYETFSINSTQPGDDNDRDSGSYYGNLGLAQFENITVGNRYAICRGGDFKSATFTPSGAASPTNGVVAGVFSVRMVANPNETHAFRCVYRPLKRSPALDTDRDSTDRDPDSEDPTEDPTEDPEDGRPEAPTVTASAEETEVTLSWTVPSNGGSPITKAQYQYQIDDGSFNGWQDISDSEVGEDNENSYTVTPLTYDTNYTFEVRVTNDQGFGPEGSVSVRTKEKPAVAPDAPTRLTAIAKDGEVALSWEVPSYDGGSLITKYQYQQKVSGGTFGGWSDTSDSEVGEDIETRFLVKNLTNGTAYTFEVRAVNGVSEGAAVADSATATPTAEATAPSPPISLIASKGNAIAELSWTPSLGDGGSAITEHKYRKRDLTLLGDWGEWTAILNSSNATSYAVTTDLINGHEYSFQVIAVNNVGPSEASNSVSVTPSPPATAPDAPTNLTATVGPSEVTLSWTSPSDGGSPITGYKYKKKVGSTAWEASWTSILTSINDEEVNATSYRVTSLINATAYTFKVQAVNAQGSSGNSNEVVATPASGAQTPLAPRNLSVNPGSEEVTLTWEESPSDRGSTITGYAYQYKTSGGWGVTWTSIANSAPGETSETKVKVTTLTNDTDYSFRVSAINAEGHSEESNTVTATPSSSYLVPSAPTGLLGDAGNAKATLNWTPSDHNGRSSISRHEYQKKTDDGEFGLRWVPITDSSPNGDYAISFTVTTGLTNGITYIFRVRAVNQEGGGPESNEVSITPVTKPGIPLNLSASGGDKKVTLTWTLPSNGGSLITEHQYQQRQGSGAFVNWLEITNIGEEERRCHLRCAQFNEWNHL